MFVTMQCFNNLDTEEGRKPMTERFGLTMKRAGAAITGQFLPHSLANSSQSDIIIVFQSPP